MLQKIFITIQKLSLYCELIKFSLKERKMGENFPHIINFHRSIRNPLIIAYKKTTMTMNTQIESNQRKPNSYNNLDKR